MFRPFFNSFNFLFVVVGKYKNEVIAHCRAAMANNNTTALIKVIKTGEP